MSANLMAPFKRVKIEKGSGFWIGFIRCRKLIHMLDGETKRPTLKESKKRIIVQIRGKINGDGWVDQEEVDDLIVCLIQLDNLVNYKVVKEEKNSYFFNLAKNILIDPLEEVIGATKEIESNKFQKLSEVLLNLLEQETTRLVCTYPEVYELPVSETVRQLINIRGQLIHCLRDSYFKTETWNRLKQCLDKFFADQDFKEGGLNLVGLQSKLNDLI